MIRRLATILVLFTFFACSLAGLVISLAADQAIITAADMAMQPDSASDIIIRSRTTAPADRSNAGWLGAGLVALTIVGLGGVFVSMKGGAEFFKQFRLLKKSNKRQREQQPPYLQPAYEPPYSELPTAPSVRRVPELPAWSEYENHQPR